MPALEFTNQRERLQRTIEAALAGTTFVESHSEEDGRMVVVSARKPDGTTVGVRFRAVSRSTASAEPQAGSALRLKSVGSAAGFSIWHIIFPFRISPNSGYARVRIEAGQVQIDITCQDAEWWQEG